MRSSSVGTTETGLEQLSWRDIVSSASVAIIVAVLLRIFFLGAFEIPSHSMENTLLAGDYIIVNKLGFAFRDPHRGDVVIFNRKADSSAQSETYVKRVIGLPFDTITLTHEGVWVNGRPLPDPPEARLPADPMLATQKSPVEIIVGPDSLFVLGDNRRNSFDSRYWGCLPSDAVIGAPLFIYWSRGSSQENPLPHIRWDRILSRIK